MVVYVFKKVFFFIFLEIESIMIVSGGLLLKKQNIN